MTETINESAGCYLYGIAVADLEHYRVTATAIAVIRKALASAGDRT